MPPKILTYCILALTIVTAAGPKVAEQLAGALPVAAHVVSIVVAIAGAVLLAYREALPSPGASKPPGFVRVGIVGTLSAALVVSGIVGCPRQDVVPVANVVGPGVAKIFQCVSTQVLQTGIVDPAAIEAACLALGITVAVTDIVQVLEILAAALPDASTPPAALPQALALARRKAAQGP